MPLRRLLLAHTVCRCSETVVPPRLPPRLRRAPPENGMPTLLTADGGTPLHSLALTARSCTLGL